MTDRKLRLGAVGLGRAFSLMLPTLLRHPLIEVVAGADPRAEAQTQFTKDFSRRAYSTIEELCADLDVEAVYISTPHELHADQVKYAAAKGKHVLCEKPMALTLEDCEAMTQAAFRAGVALVIGHSHSFDAPIVKARELIESGQFGKLRMIHSMNYTDWLYRPRRPEELSDGGGVLFNQAPHQVDVARYLAGGDVKTVRALTGAWDGNRPATGAYSALLTFADGAFASLTYSGFAHFDSDEFMNWIGEGGQPKDGMRYGAARRALAATTGEEEARWKNARIYGGSDFHEPRSLFNLELRHPHFGVVVASCDHADLRPTADGVMVYADGEQYFEALPPPTVPRAEVIDEFHAAAMGGKPPLHDGAWAMATMEVCLAIGKSAAAQRDVFLQHQVALP
jgi:phthalate 4,5-cis-dihydrodiol dehydrogenase